MSTLRHLLLAAAFVWVACPQAAQAGLVPDLIDATLGELIDGLSMGCFNSTDLVEAYLARIGEVNEQAVHAVTEVNPDAFAIAESLDEDRAVGVVRGPLHGIPILVKNTIATMGAMNTTAGSTLLLGAQPHRDASVVKKLREAGAIILGKTNLSQWQAFRSSNWTSGWSAHGGQVLGAYHPEQDPIGSSSGSAVATDLGLAFAALGTDTTGSILSPAGRNGIVGIRPTMGTTSSDLVIPISQRLDVVGTMARTVRDAAQVLGVISEESSLAQACEENSLAGATIGYPSLWRPLLNRTWHMTRGPEAANSEILAFERALVQLRAKGAKTVRVDLTWAALQAFNRSRDLDTVFQADFAAELPLYLDQLRTNPHGVHSVADLMNQTQSSPAEEYPLRDTFHWEMAVRSGGPDSSEVRDAWARVQRWTEAIGIGRVDAMVLPLTFLYMMGAGLPGVTVPLGHYPDTTPVKRGSQMGGLIEEGPGIPFGLTFVGAPGTDRKLIGIACAYEQESRVRMKANVRRFVLPRTKLVSRDC